MRRGAFYGSLVTIGALLLGACSSVNTLDPQEQREYFSEAEYGKASPRVVRRGRNVPKGGGRYHVGKPYRVAGRTFVPQEQPDYSARGKASWYGAAFHGRQTANGEIYDMNALTAAHPTLPLPSYVRVTNLRNGRSLVVRVNDRGPFAHGRIIDLSKAAATKLGYKGNGTADVQVDYLGMADLRGSNDRKLLATYTEPSGGNRGQRARGPVRAFAAATRGTVQVAAVTPAPPRLRNVHDTAHARASLASTPADLIAPAASPTAGGRDLLAPLILSGGYVSSFAQVDGLSPAHQAAADLAR